MKKEFRSFAEARKFVQTLRLKSIEEWKEYCKSGKKPNDIPANSPQTYKKNGTWTNWGDFLGTGRVANKDRNYLKFQDAREFVQTLKIKTQTDWRPFVKSGKLPNNIPRDPPTVYKEEWKGWSDFLGNRPRYLKNPPTIEEYKEWLQSIGVKSLKELSKIIKLPKGYPKDPYYYYKKQGTWKSYGDFYGTGNISPQERSKRFLSFEDARKEVRVLAAKYKIKNWDDWKKAKKEGKIPDNIPWAPNTVYSRKRKK